jgi:ATP-binding protein involved in chromosome partitioning
MVHNLLTEFWENVLWGHLDYMIVDLPPGTGDTQLTLLQSVPVSGAVIVTTPQEVALDDARKGLKMFGRHDTPVLGIVENMSAFHCPDCGSEHAIFGEGGGQNLANEVDMPFLGEIPLDPSIREGGDEGRPMVLDDGETSQALREFATKTANMQGIVHRRSVSGR